MEASSNSKTRPARTSAGNRRISPVSPSERRAASIAAPQHEIHRHQRGRDGEGHEHPEDLIHFFQAVRLKIADADAVLLLGPSTAKHELMTYLEKHDRALARKVIGVETVDHPSDKQVVALASEAFLKQDQLEGHA